MAELLGKPQTSRIIQDIDSIDLTPWKQVPRMAGDPNYFERTLPEWRSHNRNLHEAINNLAYAGEWGLLEDELIREGYKHDELEKQLTALEKGVRRNKTVDLRQDKYDVSQAAADEQVSAGLLRAMGLTNVEIGNVNPLLGTDISADYRGNQYKIDAQQRLRRDGGINLGVTQFTPGLREEFFRRGDIPLIDLLDEVRANPRRRVEGKLLQTSDTYWNPEDLRSREFQDQINSFHKDALISSGRPGGDVKRMHNRVLPRDTQLINLHKARELLLPLTANDMQKKHLVMKENQSGSTSILVPKIMMREQMAAPISTSIVNEELKRRRRR